MSVMARAQTPLYQDGLPMYSTLQTKVCPAVTLDNGVGEGVAPLHVYTLPAGDLKSQSIISRIG